MPDSPKPLQNDLFILKGEFNFLTVNVNAILRTLQGIQRQLDSLSPARSEESPKP